ncbi:hydroxymethylbilane synthase [Costertonia aggregata]|uniref:Hydroxymethylbilane synthase n=1 Tax=Costertonia aggregata TaxID=343403 RepID=A0A7H9AP26_9FLAO|nr:hydroxymethylbilane synthase [Costertonia aggregata]QLG45177.1 hydroxymethylbilane synthase [Costertonia aggregata]
MKTIRIGTRDSQLAMWQANTVKGKLENLGYETVLVPVKSTGDLVLDKPLYEMGITGIFTKTLDVAMIKGEIDIAVHSMKDVPTALPDGIVQAAVLERGQTIDLLAYNNNQEFLAQKDAIIATGSLRRKAMWLNRYPTHTVVDLRGNVNSRLEKLKNNDWNGAIFAAAGLNRIGLEHENTIGLSWMTPAPAQGAVMVVAMENDDFVLDACEQLNHKETEICTYVEREFLRHLEGGCSAPIGALAYINERTVTLSGVLLAVDGSKKLECEMDAPVGVHQNLGRAAAEKILNKGGKRLMNEMIDSPTKADVFSTKKLTNVQVQLFDQKIKVKSEDFVKINPSRISPIAVKNPIKNVIITSKNTVDALLTNFSPVELQFQNIYCVGRKTKRLVERKIGKVAHSENSAKKLAEYLVEFMEGLEVTYFCSNLRMDDLPDILTENNITVHEVEAYKTKFSSVKVNDSVKVVLFFSPSTVESYLLENHAGVTAYCIGETTATEARKHFKTVHVAKIPTAESLIELVNENNGK